MQRAARGAGRDGAALPVDRGAAAPGRVLVLSRGDQRRRPPSRRTRATRSSTCRSTTCADARSACWCISSRHGRGVFPRRDRRHGRPHLPQDADGGISEPEIRHPDPGGARRARPAGGSGSRRSWRTASCAMPGEITASREGADRLSPERHAGAGRLSEPHDADAAGGRCKGQGEGIRRQRDGVYRGRHDEGHQRPADREGAAPDAAQARQGPAAGQPARAVPEPDAAELCVLCDAGDRPAAGRLFARGDLQDRPLPHGAGERRADDGRQDRHERRERTLGRAARRCRCLSKISP